MRKADKETLRDFYEKSQQELYAYALSLAGDAAVAEDVIQTVFCRLLAARGLPMELRPYAFRAVRNAAIDQHRAAAAADRAAAMLQRLNGTTAPQRLAEQEEAASWLALLSGDEHEAVVLKLYSGLSFREIAVVREVSVNTASSWYRRGIERIRTHLMENDK